MKILLLDIETSAHLAFVWGLWEQDVSTNMLVKPKAMISWAAKWADKPTIMYEDCFTNEATYVKNLHKLLDEADVVVHYNGVRFDIPIINMAFLLEGLLPPSPYRQIDLLVTARRQFKFASNKLAYISEQLGMGSKLKHEGFELWKRCMAGEATAWAKMKKYNIQDVRLLTKLYKRLLPWIKNHPNFNMTMDETPCCPSCGHTTLQRRGTALNQGTRYQRFQCQSCGSWSRNAVNEGPRPREKRMSL